MTFSELTNQYVLLLFFLLFCTLLTGFVLGLKNGGWNQHLPYLFTLLISAQYYLISPLYFYINKRAMIIGTDISEYYGLGAFFPLIGLFTLVIGYWIRPVKIKHIDISFDLKGTDKEAKKYITRIFIIIYGIVITNMAVGGIDVTNIFLGDTTVGLGAKGETYFLQNFADSLISLIILAYVFKVKKSHLLIGILLSFFLFSLLGFRYRILLTLFGLGFTYLYFHKLNSKAILVGLTGILLFFYFVMLVTENRFTLVRKEYVYLRFDPTTFNYNNYFEQTRGSLADMAIYKVYDNPNKEVSHDYGASMFAYIFVRMIPRIIYPDKDDFYPPPQTKVQMVAYDAWWAKLSGEAILSTSCFYIAFGWFGVIFFHFLWGILLRNAERSVQFNDKTQIVLYIVLALVTFQWITRAYLPQAVDHAVYLLIPVIILRYLLKRRNINSSVNVIANERRA